MADIKKQTLHIQDGCDIGARPINLHLKNFERLGIKIDIDQDYENLICSCEKIKGDKIELDFPSVGATENLILATCLAAGTTEILNAAMEPEIIDLQNCLNKMGAKVKGAGTSRIIIEGVQELNRNIKYKIMADRIETGTFLCAAAITGSNICLKEADSSVIMPVINKLEETGCKINSKEKEIQIIAPKHLHCVDFTTMPYPGFPTDMQSIFAGILTIAKGTSVIVENIFENRYKYISELNKMGAKISIEGKVATIKGVRRLYGTEVKSVDLRGGAALVIAALSTKNITQVLDIEYILRGYEKLDKKLQNIGADIKLEEN